VDAIENRLSSHRRWNDHPPLLAIFPFTDSDIVKIEYEFSAGIMNMVSKSIDGRFEESSRHIKPRVLLWNTFVFKKSVRVTPEKRINPPASVPLHSRLCLTQLHRTPLISHSNSPIARGRSSSCASCSTLTTHSPQQVDCIWLRRHKQPEMRFRSARSSFVSGFILGPQSLDAQQWRIIHVDRK
jgi:hypothetical protein